jgi:predicted membrane-bound spermidine synthase
MAKKLPVLMTARPNALLDKFPMEVVDVSTIAAAYLAPLGMTSNNVVYVLLNMLTMATGNVFIIMSIMGAVSL